jgi:hypothetical protein
MRCISMRTPSTFRRQHAQQAAVIGVGDDVHVSIRTLPDVADTMFQVSGITFFQCHVVVFDDESY